MEGLLKKAQSHIFLRDGETEAQAGHDMPRIMEKQSWYHLPDPQLSGQWASHRASHPPHLAAALQAPSPTQGHWKHKAL